MTDDYFTFHLLNKAPNHEECDATGDAMKNSSPAQKHKSPVFISFAAIQL